MTKVNASSLQNAGQSCIIFNSSTSTDVQNYISAIEARIGNTTQQIQNLASTSSNKANLAYIAGLYVKQN